MFTMSQEERGLIPLQRTIKIRQTNARSKEPRQYYIAFGAGVPAAVRASAQEFTEMTPAQTTAELAHLARRIVDDDFCIVNGELDLRDVKAHFAATGQRNNLVLQLKDYSIFIVAKNAANQLGIALIHTVQRPVELARRQVFDPATMFNPTGFAIDLICATRAGRDLVNQVYRFGRRLFKQQFSGVFLESIGSARNFYINRANFTPLNPTILLQSMKDGPARGYIDRDHYNMHLPR